MLLLATLARLAQRSISKLRATNVAAENNKDLAHMKP
jgi:hypothetical protein